MASRFTSRVWTAYQQSLATKPFITNAWTTSGLFAAGDCLAQALGQAQEKPLDKKPPVQSPISTDSKLIPLRWDWQRTCRAGLYGTLFSPLGTWWYGVLARITWSSGWRTLTVRVAVDQLMFAPFGVCLYYSVMALLEGHGIHGAMGRVHVRAWNTLKANWSIWPLFQAVNLSMVPLQNRLLTANLVALCWNAYLSGHNAMR
ncbi:hypothetical protein TBLA_0A01200 [Henningerozyma blattae CBS 6284]|uniref:Protein SYM1 n=1 Tax=Henningerozyma blattae (strain ATCC 34711 / CBS 6284 / DSM 70876 / NBRC 10599 / NRRL Y-10934 / UCD 77-7) TaxID=1071380 RepID=I2GUW8_HENB6|nr:hypothetical protein TBLA_0A01200 [Tetrapisispora blattae CBS 6284]CCH57920.1 hypothetical protein TBLA_0A01200 [Tetrapisispora blattae CBS 6284]